MAWLHVLVETAVNVLLKLATKTFPADGVDGDGVRDPEPDPVDTEPAVAKFEGLLVLPSLSTLRVLLDLLAT